jgi:hypothetical protein
LSLVGLIAAAMALSASSSRRQAGPPTPLQLFQKMLPVIRHPRCANCHGGIDPRTPAHQGMKEVLGGSDCDVCHGDTDVSPKSDDWVLPGKDHFFVGKTDEELCSLYSEFAMKQGHARFMSNHINGDTLIGAAFVGLIGGARTPGAGTPPDPPADPPPISKKVFSKLAQDWLDQGQGACEVLGTIVLEESVTATDSFSTGPIGNLMKYSGKRTVTVTLQNGRYNADITIHYTVTQISKHHMVSPKTGQPCDITYTRDEDHTGGGNGGAAVTIKDTVFFADTKPPQTDYRIDVKLPQETTQKNESRTVQDGCGLGVPFPPEHETGTYTWGPESFVIEGHVEDPSSEGRAGTCDKIVKFSDIHKLLSVAQGCFRFPNMGNSWQPGLMMRNLPPSDHADVDIPYHLSARWNLKYK